MPADVKAFADKAGFDPATVLLIVQAVMTIIEFFRNQDSQANDQFPQHARYAVLGLPVLASMGSLPVALRGYDPRRYTRREGSRTENTRRNADPGTCTSRPAAAAGNAVQVVIMFGDSLRFSCVVVLCLENGLGGRFGRRGHYHGLAPVHRADQQRPQTRFVAMPTRTARCTSCCPWSRQSGQLVMPFTVDVPYGAPTPGPGPGPGPGRSPDLIPAGKLLS